MSAATGAAPTGDDWAYEIKWDGMRILCDLHDGCQLFARSGRDVTASFPELHSLASSLGVDQHKRTLLDGEVVTFVDGFPSFVDLQRRMHVSNPSSQLLRSTPVTYMIFDLLFLDDQPVHTLDYLRRRSLLAELVEDSLKWAVPPHAVGDGTPLLELSRRLGLEGVVAKKVDGIYVSGRRSSSWVKIKNVLRQEFAVGGWVAGTGSLANTVGSVLVGFWSDDSFVFAGAVGSGLTDEVRQRLLTTLHPTKGCPFSAQPFVPGNRTVTWTDPTIVVEVSFTAWTEGDRLRHPTFCGLRFDKNPILITQEPWSDA